MTSTPSPRPAPRNVSRWWLRLGLLFALLWLAAAMLWLAVQTVPYAPVHVMIDGEDVLSGFDLAGLDAAAPVALLVAVAVTLVVLLVVVPVALLVALLGLASVLLLTVGLPLLAMLGVFGLLLSPLALLIWLIWRALRPSSTTMAA